MCNCNKNKASVVIEFPQSLKQLTENNSTKYVFTPISGNNFTINNFNAFLDILDVSSLKIKSRNQLKFKLEQSRNDTKILNRPSGVGAWTILAIIKNINSNSIQDKNIIYFK